MEEDKVEPTVTTYTTILDACAKVGCGRPLSTTPRDVTKEAAMTMAKCHVFHRITGQSSGKRVYLPEAPPPRTSVTSAWSIDIPAHEAPAQTARSAKGDCGGLRGAEPPPKS